MILRRLGIDLGTTNVLIYVPDKGIVINEPCVVGLDASDNKVMSIGNEAKEMLGRTPESIIAAHPLKEGVIANFQITKAMLKYFINKLGGRVRIFKPEVMVAIPAGVTSTEKRAVVDACIAAGAKNAYVIKEPIAAALGAGIPIAAASGNMIIDIGGGTSEIAVIALGDIVASSSVRVGGNKMDQAIASFIRKKYNLVIGESTAENIKIKIGSALPLKKELTMEVSGCNTITGLPESVMVSSSDVVIGIREVLTEIIAAVKQVLQHTPPELASDIMDKGVVMTGGGSQLRSLDKMLTKVIGVPCQTAEDPVLCVAKGTGIAVENLESFKKSVLWAR
ncbi:MAG: rod shape-determining protein MreB, rod shape-determining protein MreB-related protein [Berkelbacteria bacterium GW2011_GWE1_39_12]|uniref:Cell shape-determining protein MreB n=1 Tax=Berkelbacteria bacterium GW2011_GWE1_39_12 TaxID=1618337 RepID=A0A0G4B719_9BACT|nr:MAG: rod shape-determining protein MreB, rod shape-determining protein MreB-related protein [Berkelbacteria bacterium GW2011_GWE1_39_12]